MLQDHRPLHHPGDKDDSTAEFYDYLKIGLVPIEYNEESDLLPHLARMAWTTGSSFSYLLAHRRSMTIYV